MKKFRKNNKGFTLVELIIVVAIIAILAAVAAPQYIKYVENSRQGTDANCMNEIAHAAEIAMVGDGSTAPDTNEMTVTIATDGSFSYDSGTLADAVAEIVAPGSYTFKSDAYTGAGSIDIEVNATTGKAEWTAP